MSNIKVSSGATTLISGSKGDSSTSGGMLVPYWNERNNKRFLIDVAKGASLEIDNNNKADGVISFTGESNSVDISNSGMLKINSNIESAPIFGPLVGGGNLTTNSGSITNLSALGATFDATKMNSNAWMKLKLTAGSKTSIISKDKSPFSNNGPWSNPSNISIASSAKLLTYSGDSAKGGLTDTPDHDIPVTFIGGSVIQGYSHNKITSIPTGVDDYDRLDANDVNPFVGGQTISSSKMDQSTDSGLLVFPTLLSVAMGEGKYYWNYGLDQLPDANQFLSRTTDAPLRFQVFDTRSVNPSFKITAAYVSKQERQRQLFSMWFKHSASEDTSTAVRLSQNAQTILTGSEMKSDGGVYTADYGKDSGLVMLANNRVRSGNYKGLVDWTLVDGV
ncbi:hypothetical protein [Pediococcus stilesii]|uniref:Cell surface protein n=1 Tax=Pediococcus stilesii TaxID=331679 RepID=A0A0R2L1Z4_9LACO|nr:hypothetical protein [Pediococcus stilesii]KRN93500.1 hypothetical protein IV81_GL000501 [Pediococcus stilesii]